MKYKYSGLKNKFLLRKTTIFIGKTIKLYLFDIDFILFFRRK